MRIDDDQEADAENQTSKQQAETVNEESYVQPELRQPDPTDLDNFTTQHGWRLAQEQR